jgi:hypothetical protein
MYLPYMLEVADVDLTVAQKCLSSEGAASLPRDALLSRILQPTLAINFIDQRRFGETNNPSTSPEIHSLS